MEDDAPLQRGETKAGHEELACDDRSDHPAREDVLVDQDDKH